MIAFSIRAETPQQDIDMLGMINRQTIAAFVKGAKKKKKKKEKKSGSTYRDYRGVEGVLDDAQKKK